MSCRVFNNRHRHMVQNTKAKFFGYSVSPYYHVIIICCEQHRDNSKEENTPCPPQFHGCVPNALP